MPVKRHRCDSVSGRISFPISPSAVPIPETDWRGRCGTVGRKGTAAVEARPYALLGKLD